MPADQCKQKHILHGHGCAIHDLADLLENGIDVEYRECRKLAHQIGQRRPLCRRQINACHVGPRGSIEQPRREHQKEIRPETVPAYFARLATSTVNGSPRRYRRRACLPSFSCNASWYSGGYGDQVLAGIRGRPPAPCDQLIVVHQVGGPRSGSALSPGSRGPESPCTISDSLGMELMANDARTHHGEHLRPGPRRAIAGMPAKGARSSGRMLIKKIIGRVGGQTVPPISPAGRRAPLPATAAPSTPDRRRRSARTLPAPRLETLARP